MTPEPGKQIIVIHILPNFSRKKGNRTIKFGQLKGYNMKNITKCSGETSPRPFSGKLKLSISLDQ